MTRRTCGALLVFACFYVLSIGAAPARDAALLIGAGKYQSGKWALPLVAENLRLMEKALREEVGVAPEDFEKLENETVTRDGIRYSLAAMARTLRQGDRLFVYYTGHATKVMAAGAPIRAYFTWFTMESPGEGGFDPETLLTDLDLAGWIEPLRKNKVLVIVIREACFCGGGYDEDIASLSPGLPPRRKTVGDLEISACNVDEAAWALEGAKPPRALFTSCVAEALAADAQKITAGGLFDRVRSRVTSRRKGQTPVLDHAKEVDPARIVLVDRTAVDLLVTVRDAVTKEPLSGAAVILEVPGRKESWTGKTPSARLPGVPRRPLLFPWIEREGYVPKSRKVAVPPKERLVKVEAGLDPEVAEVTGRIEVEGGGSLAGITLAYESGKAPLDPRHVDVEVRPRPDGSFVLRVPPRAPCRVMAVKGAETLASVSVDGGRSLEPVRWYDSAKSEWRGAPYDVGTISVTVREARPAMTEAEKAYEDYLGQARDAEERNDLDEAARCFGLAGEAAAMAADPAMAKDLARRARKGLERVEAKRRARRYDALVEKGKSLLKRKDMEGARETARSALALNPSGVMARLLLKDAESRLEEKERAEEAARKAAAAERKARERAGAPASKRETRRGASSAPRVPGFSYLRKETFSCGGQTHTVKIYRHDRTGLEFVLVPGGSFEMGSPPGEDGRYNDEGPRQHRVTVKPFLLCRTEVSNKVFRRFRKDHDSGSFDGLSLNGNTQPAVNVSWNDAMAFCDWASAKLRLPSEAEWEYACRAGTGTSRFWGEGEGPAGTYANVADRTAKRKWGGWTIMDTDDGYAVTAPVGSFSPNAFGLYDMIGNVWEWCEDQWHDNYSGAPTDGSAWTAGGSSRRVIRGGSWLDDPLFCRSADRSWYVPGLRDFYLGFRPACSLP